MLDDLLALLDKPLVLLIVLAIGGVIGILLESTLNRIDREKRHAYWRGRHAAKGAATPVRGKPEQARLSAADQLRRVMGADFKPRSLLNKSEARVFRELDRMVIARNPGWQVMAQVCVGEFVACADAEAYGCVNSKRVDLLLMDEACRARHAIEYQGTGHHQGTAAARDAVKKEALRKAGIGYHEVVAGHTTPADLKRLVEKLVPVAEGEKAA
jgi:hypothetical protein